MSCTVQTKSLNRLKEINVLSKTREILNHSEFDRLNNLYTKTAIDKWGLPTNGEKLFTIETNTVNKERGNRIRTGERTIFRAVPNEKLFKLLNDIIVDYENNLSDNTVVSEKDNTQFQKAQNIEGEYNDVVSPFEKMTRDEQVAFEKTVRDLSARIADRIGISYRIENRKDLKYKGKIEGNTAVINLAYATLDTPIHEILGHPIIRAIRNKNRIKQDEYSIKSFTYKGDNYKTEKDIFGYSYKNGEIIDDKEFDKIAKEYLKEGELQFSQLYQNLLKELGYGKGKEVLDRIKREYNIKELPKFFKYEVFYGEDNKRYNFDGSYYTETIENDPFGGTETKQISKKEYDAIWDKVLEDKNLKYTIEEQQEEAIVELLGLYTADRLDKVKDGKLISLLKRLLKEMKAFVRSLLNQKEVEIDKLPDNMTLGDIADLLAYSNSKLILPGNEVVYTTPDNQQFKTYVEASKHISDLVKLGEVDLSNINLDNIDREIPKYFNKNVYKGDHDEEHSYFKHNNKFYHITPDNIIEGIINPEETEEEYYNQLANGSKEITEQEFNKAWKDSQTYGGIQGVGTIQSNIKSFIEKNKEYEQSREIIEEWKRVNNIQYNPEEVYSRGQEFVSVVGAYSDFDVNLMIQNLLQHIEDNKKAGGEFTISAFTKPVDRQIGHLEGGGGKIKFKIYPQSQDIKWAANTDVYSGSVWDASEKVNKDKKSEIIGVSYTKSPSLRNINVVQPNLASIIDNLAHHHNELGIELTGSNFRLEYDKDIPYTTKKIIDTINSILDQKYGKLVKPNIDKVQRQSKIRDWRISKAGINEGVQMWALEYTSGNNVEDIDGDIDFFTSEQEARDYLNKLIENSKKKIGIQPTQTKENLKESIESVKNKYNTEIKDPEISNEESFTQNGWTYVFADWMDVNKQFSRYKFIDGQIKTEYISKEKFNKVKKDYLSKNKKEYTSQAEINTKVAALKEGQRKFPRSLVRSEVRPIGKNEHDQRAIDLGFDPDEFPFQKINLTKDLKSLEGKNIDNILQTYESEVEVNNNQEIVNMNNFILFNNESGKFTAKEVLNNIKNNFRNFTPAANELIDKLIPILEKTKATIRFVNSSTFKSDDTLMQYSDTKNEIQISKDKLNQIDEEYAVRTFLHEVIHSVTVNAYNRPNSIEEQMFRTFIEEMFNKYKKLSGYKEGDKISETNYGFTRAEEFIAEIMTNQEFQDEIKRLDKKGLWDKLVDYIRTLLGLSKNSDYNNIIDSITSIIKTIDNENNYSEEEVIFEKVDTSENKENLGNKRLRTIADKLNYTMDNVLNVLKHNIGLYDHLIKTIKDPSKLEKYNKKQKEILENIEELNSTNQWKAITLYIKSLSDNIYNLNEKFNKEDLTDDDVIQTIGLYKKYLHANNMVEGIQELLSRARFEKDLPITKEELAELQNKIKEASGEKQTLEAHFLEFSRIVMFDKLNTVENSREVRKEFENKLRKEHKDLGISENFQSWFIRQIGKDGAYEEEFKEAIADRVHSILNDPFFDITTATFMFNSTLNTNSDIVQLMNNMITTMKNTIIDRKRDFAMALQKDFEELVKAVGNKKPSELYKNMYEKTKDGETILKGKYTIKFKETFEALRDKYNLEKAQLEKEYGIDSNEVKDYIKNSEFSKWKKENLKTVKNGDKTFMTPADKWLTDESNMSEAEIKFLHKARVRLNAANKETYGINSLLSKPLYTAIYYKLPAMTKTDLERTLEGNMKGIIKDKVKDLTTIREDDLGYEETMVDGLNNPVLKPRIYYRGKLDNDQQSLDLATLLLAEGYNSINFREKSNVENEANMLLDIAKNSKVYQTKGFRKLILGRFRDKNKEVESPGSDSNVYKKLKSLVESNIYDILHKHQGKWGPIDINKAIGFANGFTAMVGLTFNEVSAAANVLNGKAQLFLEGIAGNYVSFRNIAEAEKDYFADLKNNFEDISRPIDMSMTNQTNEMFDTFGTVNPHIQQAFLQNTLMKASLDAKSLQFMQSTGEHWMQSVLTNAVLKGIKVMNGNGEFINKNGDVVKTEKEAASLSDMRKFDKNGKLIIDPKVVYTTHTLGVKYNEGGKEMLTKLVKKKVFDTAGNYDPTTQPDAMRHAYGKLTMMYRRFFIPMGVARFRGFMYAHKDLNDLENYEKFFSEGLQDYETGTYTEFTRLIIQGFKSAIIKRDLSLISDNWKNLTDTQKKQIYKAVTEAIITGVLIPSAIAILGMLQGGDGDDDDFIWFSLLQLRRLQSELSSYRDIDEQWRILQSPIPATRMIENSFNLLDTLFSPSQWDERIKSGPNKDNLRIVNDLSKITPIWTQINKSYKGGYQFFENMAN